MDTTVNRYFVLPDAAGDVALWRGSSPDDEHIECVVYRYELNRLDSVLWPALVEHFHARTAEMDALLVSEVRDAYRLGGLIPAIRAYRQNTVAGLREGKAAVQAICAGLEAPAGARA